MGTSDPEIVPVLSQETLDMIYPLLGPVKGYIKAVEAEVFARLQRGDKFAHAKLVRKKADRVWREGALEALTKAVAHDSLFTAPALKSPAQVEKIDAPAKVLVREWAYTPDVGVTVAPMDDGRPEVVIKSMAENFPNATKE
jgi:hypothetical protein